MEPNLPALKEPSFASLLANRMDFVVPSCVVVQPNGRKVVVQVVRVDDEPGVSESLSLSPHEAKELAQTLIRAAAEAEKTIDRIQANIADNE